MDVDFQTALEMRCEKKINMLANYIMFTIY